MSTDISTADLIELIRRALVARDWRGVEAGLRVLAVQSPKDAEAILDTINLVARRPE